MFKLSPSLLLVTLLATACSSVGPQNIDLNYSGLKFKAPANGLSILSNFGQSNILAIRYGQEAGTQYLAFHEMNDKPGLDYGCDPAVFFNEVFMRPVAETCNSEQLKAFRIIFLSEGPQQIWNGPDAVAYHTVLSDSNFVFLASKAGKVIQIDTDFMSTAELKEVVSNHIQ